MAGAIPNSSLLPKFAIVVPIIIFRSSPSSATTQRGTKIVIPQNANIFNMFRMYRNSTRYSTASGVVFRHSSSSLRFLISESNYPKGLSASNIIGSGGISFFKFGSQTSILLERFLRYQMNIQNRIRKIIISNAIVAAQPITEFTIIIIHFYKKPCLIEFYVTIKFGTSI